MEVFGLSHTDASLDGHLVSLLLLRCAAAPGSCRSRIWPCWACSCLLDTPRGARMVMLLENERAVTADAQQCRSGEQSVQPWWIFLTRPTPSARAGWRQLSVSLEQAADDGRVWLHRGLASGFQTAWEERWPEAARSRAKAGKQLLVWTGKGRLGGFDEEGV